MENLTGMNTLKECEKGQVEKIFISGKMRNRLNDLGLIEGTCIECLYRNHGLSAYLIRGAVIALRTEDTSFIKVTKIKADT
ncbi:MAG: ferrous iron transport protein A [Ruminococcus sp.]|nr:ferrous iron transport protein A [Ruminococcus sp.]